MNLEQAAQLGVLLAGVVLAEAALPHEPMTRSVQREQDFSTVALSRSVAVL